jgi:uncharacterized protein YfbU (UPF0304 family)
MNQLFIATTIIGHFRLSSPPQQDLVLENKVLFLTLLHNNEKNRYTNRRQHINDGYNAINILEKFFFKTC